MSQTGYNPAETHPWNESRRPGGYLSLISPFNYFPKFSAWLKRTLASIYYVQDTHMPLQLSYGNICQMRIWRKVSSRHFFSKLNMFNEKRLNVALVISTAGSMDKKSSIRTYCVRSRGWYHILTLTIILCIISFNLQKSYANFLRHPR